jgi:hypothetical protein
MKMAYTDSTSHQVSPSDKFWNMIRKVKDDLHLHKLHRMSSSVGHLKSILYHLVQSLRV